MNRALNLTVCGLAVLLLCYCSCGDISKYEGDGDDDIDVVSDGEGVIDVDQDLEEDPAQEPAEDPIEEPAEDPSEDPIEEPAEDPSEDPIEEPAEDPSEDPIEEPAGDTTEDPAEEPTEDTVEEPGEDSIEDPAGDADEDPGTDTVSDTTTETVTDPITDLAIDLITDRIIDPITDPITDLATEPDCGNGIVEPPETCDDDSGFCVGCALTCPHGWTTCTDSHGATACLLLVDWSGSHSWMDYRDHCKTIVEGFSPVNFAHYGLGVFHDQSIFNCISPSMTATRYFGGLHQDTTASDYVEPDGGWYWEGYDGTGWTNIVAWDPSNGFLTGNFDDGGGGTDVECIRYQAPGSWGVHDFSCTDTQDWPGICMIQF